MKKRFILAGSLFLIMVRVCGAQKTEDIPVSITNEKEKAFVAYKPTKETTDIFDVTGTGNVVYTTANYSDGTPNSFKHTLTITVALYTAKNRTGNYQLAFYSPDDKIPYSAIFLNDALTIYYPISLYESISKKLDDAVAGRKKIQVKVVQKPNGYREGTLIL